MKGRKERMTSKREQKKPNQSKGIHLFFFVNGQFCIQFEQTTLNSLKAGYLLLFDELNRMSINFTC